MNTMSTLSLFTSQILLWNYLFLLALKKTNIFLIIAHRVLPQKNKTGGEREEGASEGGLFTH